MTDAQRTNYANLLDSVVQSDIYDLLKRYKDDNKDIIKLVANKSIQIQNLLNLVELKIISEIEVQALIKDSEEYGNQYVLLFQPSHNASSINFNDGDKIINAAISRSVRDSFPKLIENPSQFEWADFRYPNRGNANSWLLKIYDVKTRDVKKGDVYDPVNRQRHIVYEPEDTRMIYILEWNGRGQLEIRISRTTFDSTKTLEETLHLIFSKLSNGGKGLDFMANFVPLDLSNCVNNILSDFKNQNNVYKIMSANWIDAHDGLTTIKSQDVYGNSDIFSEGSRKKAVEAHLEGGSKAIALNIKFLASGSSGELQSDVSVIFSKDAINKIVIPANINPQDYKYVRRKIAEFS